MLRHPLQGEVRIFRRLMQAGGEIVEAAGQPWIMLAQTVHAQRNQVPGKQFGQRRGNCLQEGTILHQIKISINGVTYGGQDFVAVHHPLAIQTGRLRQLDPTLDTAFLCRIAIMIDHSLTPRPAKIRILAARKNNSVLDGNAALIVIAVQGPSLHLPAAQSPLVHHEVKRMLMVIAFFAHTTQPRFQLFCGQNRRVHHSFYRLKWHPSSATSQPAERTALYSELDSSSMGLVLLMCKKILRGRLSPAKACKLPSAPDTGTCPISRAVAPLP